MSNIVKAVLTKGTKSFTTTPLYQYDYGQVMQIVGMELPSAYEVHFSNSPQGQSTTAIGDETGVIIPDAYLQSGGTVYAWLFLHTGEDDGETVYRIEIPVIQRASITNDTPTPVQQDAITQAIAALNSGVQTVEGIAEGIPQTINDALAEAKASGEFDGKDGKDGKDGADGAPGLDGYTPVKGVDYFDGQDGAPGKDGQDGSPGEPGQDGISPTIAVTDITGGHRVTITDETGDHSFDVMDGQDAENPVTDVQVNGTSILNNGVANVPIADTTNPGAIIIGSGLSKNVSNKLVVDSAGNGTIKAGANINQPIVPGRQDISTFYGLAKAAGADMASSSNAVGSYTDTAKSKIQDMIGISGIIGTNEGATASQAYTTGKAFLHGGKLYKATTNIGSGDAIVPGTNCTQTTLIELIG